jgi:hypothetical protein
MRSRANTKRGQAVFEYFILSIIVVSLALYFMQKPHYVQIYDAVNGTDGIFNQAVQNITK